MSQVSLVSRIGGSPSRILLQKKKQKKKKNGNTTSYYFHHNIYTTHFDLLILIIVHLIHLNEFSFFFFCTMVSSLLFFNLKRKSLALFSLSLPPFWLHYHYDSLTVIVGSFNLFIHVGHKKKQQKKKKMRKKKKKKQIKKIAACFTVCQPVILYGCWILTVMESNQQLIYSRSLYL